MMMDGQPLSLVDSHTYRGVTISSDLHWQNHTFNISAKASRILNFVRRNVYGSSAEAKATAYTTFGILISSIGPTFSQGHTPT